MKRYMTDAHLSGLAKELREKGVTCDTVHKLMRGTEDSRIKITDPEIVKFLTGKNKSVALITLDNELAEYCSTLDIPVIRVQDLVWKHIQSALRDGDRVLAGDASV
jgi:hypothetical protein